MNPESAQHAPFRILVVDDEPANCDVVTAQLRGEGYDIRTAGSGEEALRLIDAELPDLILLDAMMAGLSGFDVAEILKGEERSAQIPIIMLTALGDSDSRLSALNSGVEEFLTKPVARAELIVRIRNLLKLKRYQDVLALYSTQLESLVEKRTSELASANRQLNDLQIKALETEKLASIGQLAAGVAHEINNPIGFVNSNLGTLRGYMDKLLGLLDAYAAIETTLPEESTLRAGLEDLKAKIELEYLASDAPALIAESIEGITRVRKIVQDLKDFSRVDTNQEWLAADIHACIESTLNVAKNEIKYKANVVREFGELPPVECLPSKLNQVFLNLFVNAAQAIPEGSMGQITVRTARDGDEVRIEVEDSGAGIPADILKRIFEPFFTTKPVGKGTGLGLSLAIGIVQHHHGHITCDSEVGRGTRFTITLPVRQPPRKA